MAGDGYTVQAAALDAGGRQARSLEGDCEQVAGRLAARLEALAIAAGSPAVEAGVRRVAKSAVEQLLGAAAGYRNAAAQLAQTAASYSRAESSAVSSVHGVASRPTG